jgi:hypothetical protein
LFILRGQLARHWLSIAQQESGALMAQGAWELPKLSNASAIGSSAIRSISP